MLALVNLSDIDIKRYLKSLAHIPRVVLAAFGVTLLAQVFAVLTRMIHSHETAFDQAVKLLLHYPESFPAIFAFFGVNLILLCLTVLVEGSDLGTFIRERFVLPSLHILEHMISLSIGVYAALGIIESFTKGVPFGSVPKTIGAVLWVGFILFLVASICAVVAEFINGDYLKMLEKLGNIRFPVLLGAGGAFLYVLYSDFVWHFTAITNHAGLG